MTTFVLSSDSHYASLFIVETNSSAVGSERVPRSELVAQVTTLFVAGHESIAITTDLLLWELAKRPDSQDKIREEIAILRRNVAQRGDSEYTIEDLESMNYTVAVVKVSRDINLSSSRVDIARKELLRLHPTGYHVHRSAAKDDVIPLSMPVRLETGELIDEVPVEAGQNIALSLWGYNRQAAIAFDAQYRCLTS